MRAMDDPFVLLLLIPSRLGVNTDRNAKHLIPMKFAMKARDGAVCECDGEWLHFR